MLVLSRKPGEKIHIGENVTITIVRIGPNTVRLGIDAPKDMNIARDELAKQLGNLSGANIIVEMPADSVGSAA
jgi:carbon storage regulator